MKVRDLMNSHVHHCTPDTSLHHAASRMWDYDCGCLPVIDYDGRCIGMITDRDICMAAFIQGRTLQHINVAEAYSPNPVSCREDTLLQEAELKMRQFQVRRLPVVNDDEELVGILSLNDIALKFQQDPKNITARQVATILAGICEAHPKVEIRAIHQV